MSYVNVLGGKYCYCSDTNTILNGSLKELYTGYMQQRKIRIDDVNLSENVLVSKVKELRQCIVEVTQNCNLRCKYCVYSGEYKYNRTFSPKSITDSTVKKGLHYVYSLIKNRGNKSFSIGFYGGEPLLNYDLLKNSVNFARNLFQNWDLLFNLTTNLTILTTDMIDFLIKNDFQLDVSLDGPEASHDAKRVFANGDGTFNRVKANLERIKKRNETFYLNNISFSTVYSNDLPIKEFYNFFSENPLVKNLTIKYGGVNFLDTTYYQKYQYDPDKLKRQFEAIYNQIIKRFKKEPTLTPIDTAMLEPFIHMDDLIRKRRGMTLLADSCLFDSRVYLNANGNFHVCEKMNDKFPIGNVDAGFNFPQMKRIAEEFTEIIRKNCLSCEARFLCNRCFIHLATDNGFKLSDKFCRSSKKALKSLEQYVKLKEEHII